MAGRGSDAFTRGSSATTSTRGRRRAEPSEEMATPEEERQGRKELLKDFCTLLTAFFGVSKSIKPKKSKRYL